MSGGPMLVGSSLLIPSVQSEPLPIKAVQPAPCTRACPAGINVKAYVSLIAEGRFQEALEVVRERCPLPAICGRICHHPCEAVCERRTVDEPISIRALKRFVADLDLGTARGAPPSRVERGAKVAVVGSGPAGLTAAWDLARCGYQVTVFESNTEPGGMLRYGITAYRLPREVLDAEIDAICRAGVILRTGCRVGTDLELEHLLEQGYVATLFAVGAQRGRGLDIEAERDCPEVLDALAFLRRVNDGDRSAVTGKVVVIGGGSTAVEAARSALRLGAESVDILYRRYREELLADPEEIRAAEAEGISFRFLVTPVAVHSEDGRLQAVECVRVGLGEPDDSGRRRPISIPGSEFAVAADLVLAAVGQQADLDFFPPAVRSRLIDSDLIRVDPATAMTACRGVFAAGDAVSGPATVIDAIAAGHAAASSIRQFVERGTPGIVDPHAGSAAIGELELPEATPLEALRAQPQVRAIRSGHEFSEVEQALSESAAIGEARRCLRCGPCGDCRVCVPTCRRRHIMMRSTTGDSLQDSSTVLLRAASSIALNLSATASIPARLLPDAEPRLLPEIEPEAGTPVELLPVRVQVESSLCRACGLCVEVCPFAAIRPGDRSRPGASAWVEPSLCRGCNLCVPVCPTGAAQPAALSPVWWGRRLEEVFRAPDPLVVLACQRRAGALEWSLHDSGARVEVVRFRCVGQVEAGMLLELKRLGARGVLLAGCAAPRCRFDRGASMAEEQTNRTLHLLELTGCDPRWLRTDWAEDRSADALGRPVMEMVSMSERLAGTAAVAVT